MDTSELFEKLQRRIEETSRDRERLSEAVHALNLEIANLELDEEILRRAVSRFEKMDTSSRAKDAKVQVRLKADATVRSNGMLVSWPAGPGFSKPIKSKKPRAWARYKLETAKWYLRTLGEITEQHGLNTRVIGVEMAVEGATHALCSSFDAAIYALTRSVERAARIPLDRKTPPRLSSWSKLAAEARFLGIDLASSLSIADALLGEYTDAPQGWLAQLQALANRCLREDLLVTQSVGKHDRQMLMIEVPVQGPMPVLDFLTRSSEHVEELLETIFYDISMIRKRSRADTSGTGAVNANLLRVRAEQGLEGLLPEAP